MGNFDLEDTTPEALASSPTLPSPFDDLATADGTNAGTGNWHSGSAGWFHHDPQDDPAAGDDFSGSAGLPLQPKSAAPQAGDDAFTLGGSNRYDLEDDASDGGNTRGAAVGQSRVTAGGALGNGVEGQLPPGGITANIDGDPQGRAGSDSWYQHPTDGKEDSWPQVQLFPGTQGNARVTDAQGGRLIHNPPMEVNVHDNDIDGQLGNVFHKIDSNPQNFSWMNPGDWYVNMHGLDTDYHNHPDDLYTYQGTKYPELSAIAPLTGHEINYMGVGAGFAAYGVPMSVADRLTDEYCRVHHGGRLATLQELLAMHAGYKAFKNRPATSGTPPQNWRNIDSPGYVPPM